MQKWGVLFLLVLVLVLLWRARPRPRVPKPKVDPSFYDSLQDEAVRIARAVFGLGLRRLEPAQALADLEGLRNSASELFGRLQELRDAEHESTARAAWEQASLVARTRFPALHRLVGDLDLPTLEQAARVEPGELQTLLDPELEGLRHQLEMGLARLDEDPETVWGDLELVVLSLVIRGSNPDEDMAAALRAGRYSRRGAPSHDFVSRRKLAWDIAQNTPMDERADYDAVPALPTEDPKLGAALVRYHVNAAAQQPELERALALTTGQSELFFLAHEIVKTLGYPEASVRAWRRLRPLAKTALSESDERSRTELATQARDELGPEAAERLLGSLPGARL